MARPYKVGLDYFPHDTDAVNDEKIQALMALHGTAGYSFYFIMLEKVFRAENSRITIGSDAIKAGFAKTIGITTEQFNSILTTALEIGCFDAEIYAKHKIITSLGIQKRIQKVNELRIKERKRKEKEKAYISKDIYKDKHNLRKTCGIRAENSQNSLNKHSKNKNNTMDLRPIDVFQIPSLEEVTAYCLQRENKVDPEQWINHYQAKGWMIGKNKMKDWKAAVRTWENNSNNNAKTPTRIGDSYATL